MKNFQLAGNLTQDPIVHNLDEETPSKNRAGLRVAVNGREAQFFWVTVFGKQVPVIAEHLKKGDGVAVEGELSTYEDKIQLVARPYGVTFFRKTKKKDKKK